MQEEPVLKVPVNTKGETGLLGIAVRNDSSTNITNVYLYFTENDPYRNRIYKYDWNGGMLINPTLLLDLSAAKFHNGGKIAIGPDGYLYAVVGELSLTATGQLQNFPNGSSPDDTSSIFRISPIYGSQASDNPFTKSGSNASRYFAYGIRNSFGMDFDPVTGALWDTENGDANYDEINIVRPGFNSGWKTIMGPISQSQHNVSELVKLPGSHYADPILSWKTSLAPTDVEFFESSSLGDKYTNNIFVAGSKTGSLYFFEINEGRDGLKLNATEHGPGLSDRVVDDEDELSTINFGKNFGLITDIETGPDGFLYVLVYLPPEGEPKGTLYRILPGAAPQSASSRVTR
jgi:glucose/arabinose dehydrogenase